VRLKQLADRKGEGLSKHLYPYGVSADKLSRDQANAILEQLKRLPDVPPPGAEGKPAPEANGQAAK
jgi:hypothetical protein